MSAKGTSYIVINGRRYAAHGGRPLDGVSVHGKQAKMTASTIDHKQSKKAEKTPRAIDGVSGKPKRERQPTHAKQYHRSHQNANHTKNPAQKLKATPAPKPDNTPKKEVLVFDHAEQDIGLSPERAKRASHIKRSSSISKFAPGVVSSQTTVLVTETETTVEVPAENIVPPSELPAANLAQFVVEHTDKSKKKARKHTQRLRTKNVAAGVAALAILLIGGLTVWANIPNLSLRIAAARSGVDVSLPRYKPDSYNFGGPIRYGNGSVTVGFSSNQNQRTFSLTQEKSEQDPSSLLETYVRPSTNDYEIFREMGLTIYVYDNKASWVNGGIHYTIEGNSALSSEQLIKIATSL